MDADYKVEYDAFVKEFGAREIDGREAGQVIVRMAAYYATYNLRLANALKAYSIALRDISNQTDVSGKSISSARATQIAEAIDEYHLYQLQKAHVANLEQFINALKALQRGLLNEYTYQGIT